MRVFRKWTRILILFLLGVSVFVPIFLLSHKLKQVSYDVSAEFLEDLSIIKHRAEVQTLSAIEQDEMEGLTEPFNVVYKDDASDSEISYSFNNDKKFGNEVAADNVDLLESNVTSYDIKEVSMKRQQENQLLLTEMKKEPFQDRVQDDSNEITARRRTLDDKVKEMKDQVVRARAYLNFTPANCSSHFLKELKVRIKEIQRAINQATKDSRLSRSSLMKMRSMESTLLKASKMYPDCTAMVKNLRAMMNNADEQVHKHQIQENFLTDLGGRTIPKGHHCLSMRLTAEYYSLEPEAKEFPNKHKLLDPDLYHFVVFSDNILACSVVVNSTVSVAKEPESIVFHVVTDFLNFPSMSMWFLSNPPGKSTIYVESTENLQWLFAKYNASLPYEESINPRYVSALNHLRFYLPDLFPRLDKIVLLDHDVVVQRDLTTLWSVELRGKVNLAVETCKEGEPSFRRMDMFINFTDPVMAETFDSKACTWAFGLNLFDLQEWRRRDLTQIYINNLQLGKTRPLWKAGSLPMGWITFYENTAFLDKRWHVLGLGYDSGVSQDDIEPAAVLHFDGSLKPWLDTGVERYKHIWSDHVNYEHPYLQNCNIHE